MSATIQYGTSNIFERGRCLDKRNVSSAKMNLKFNKGDVKSPADNVGAGIRILGTGNADQVQMSGQFFAPVVDRTVMPQNATMLTIFTCELNDVPYISDISSSAANSRIVKRSGISGSEIVGISEFYAASLYTIANVIISTQDHV